MARLVLLLIGFFHGFLPTHACDAGVAWDNSSLLGHEKGFKYDTQKASTWPKHMKKHAHTLLGAAAGAWPTNANATSWSTTLKWEKANYDGHVFLSTGLNEGCGGGYIGAQIWGGADAFMHVDWAIWDVSDGRTSFNNTHPMTDPISQSQCNRYDGEGSGTQCGLGAKQNLTWDFSQDNSYTFNVSLVSSNSSGAVFGASMRNDKNGMIIPIGQIYTRQPPPTKSHPDGWVCDRLVVGGGSFQEYFTGGNFTNFASYEGPRFRGVAGHDGDVMPLHIHDCFFHGTCHDGPEGCCNCHNETMVHCLPPECEVPKITFMGGHDVPVPAAVIPPWDGNPHVNASIQCDFLVHTDTNGGRLPAHWGNPQGMNYGVNASNQFACLFGDLVACATHCCGFCHADPDCEMAKLHGNGCWLLHRDPTSPFHTFNASSSPDPMFPVLIVKHPESAMTIAASEQFVV